MKQKIKAVFFDFDWTLFDHKTHTFVPSAIDAINQIQKNGVKIFINSARSYYSLAGLNTFENLHFDGFVVSNGASTFLKDKILYAHFLCKEKVEEIRNVLEKENVSYMISTINDAYIKNVDNDPNVKRFYEVFYESYPKDISLYNNDDVLTIQVYVSKDKDYIFDNISFELDEEGTPWWTCSVKKFNIGLFGGETVGRLVLCNAITGETIDYAVEDVPQWVDRVYAPDMLIDLYDYYGTLKHGFLNSVLGQKDCLKTTEGYNYIALDDDVWVYTGVTSVTGDESNVGFVLMNQRTKETRYYAVTGAKEVSAMSSAEGQVQHLGYQATFPLLLNIGNEPTYFLALKDGAGLVKKYAMVNVQKYQVVAIGDTVDACQRQYMTLMKENGIESSVSQENLKEVTGVIERMAEAVVDGNSHYYLVLKGSDAIYDVSVADNLSIIRYQEGDKVTLEYTEGEAVNTVYSVNGETLSIVEEQTEDSNGMPITEE